MAEPDPDDPARRPRGVLLPLAERERQYSPSSRLVDRDLGPVLERYRAASAEARRRYPPLTISYGPRPANTIDLFLPAPPSGDEPTIGPRPLHVFIHGGYWQQLSKLDSTFLAPACLEAGHGFAAVDYTLAPEVGLDEIVAECRRALRRLHSIAPSHDLDPGAVTVSGSSAGAHLAAMATLGLDRAQRPADLILVSGIFLLEPLIGTTINEAVGLDIAAARANSPLLHSLDGFPPTVVAHGDDETDEFKRQSRAMVDALRAAHVPVAEVEVRGRNHFDVVFEIVPDLTAALGRVEVGPDRGRSA